MLSVNSDVTLAPDAFMELYRSFRNAIARAVNVADEGIKFDETTPFLDYYFSYGRLSLLDSIQEGDLSIPYEGCEWRTFVEIASRRAALECPDIASRMGELRGETYRELFDSALRLVATTREAEAKQWVGFKDVWTIEFFPALARAYPTARFIVMLRDPRAIIASMLAIKERFPSQVGHVLSYARHWRQFTAFTIHYLQHPLFADRLHIVRHEDLVSRPEETARRLCNFLEVGFEPRMLDTEQYIDVATGGVWAGNSAFEAVASGIRAERAERWRERLEKRVLKVIEFPCGPDMEVTGYEPVTEFGTGAWPDGEMLNYVIEENGKEFNWRTDFGDVHVDWGGELFRKAMLDLPRQCGDWGLVRRSFLFPEVFDALLKRQRLPVRG